MRWNGLLAVAVSLVGKAVFLPPSTLLPAYPFKDLRRSLRRDDPYQLKLCRLKECPIFGLGPVAPTRVDQHIHVPSHTELTRKRTVYPDWHYRLDQQQFPLRAHDAATVVKNCDTPLIVPIMDDARENIRISATWH